MRQTSPSRGGWYASVPVPPMICARVLWIAWMLVPVPEPRLMTRRDPRLSAASVALPKEKIAYAVQLRPASRLQRLLSDVGPSSSG